MLWNGLTEKTKLLESTEFWTIRPCRHSTGSESCRLAPKIPVRIAVLFCYQQAYLFVG